MLKIVKYPAPILRRKAESVDSVDDDIRDLIENMLDVIYVEDGVGLAAPQVGVSKRVIVVDDGKDGVGLINPEIVKKSSETDTMEEGCLSLPGIRLNISRPVRITVKGLDENGDSVELQADGLLAKVIQHEIDHLNGILIINHVSTIHKTILRSKLKKLEDQI